LISVQAQIGNCSRKKKLHKFEDHKKKDLELMDEEKKGLIMEKLLRKLWKAGFSRKIEECSGKWNSKDEEL